MIEEMHQGDARRFAERVALMPKAEVVVLHEAACSRFEAALSGGYDLPRRVWDELGVLQARRADLLDPVKPEPPRVPWVQVTHEDGLRLRYPIRCF